MPEHDDSITMRRVARLWNGWALGMFLGFIALGAMFFGWRQTIHLGNRWAVLSSQMQEVCRDQEAMTVAIDRLMHGQPDADILGNEDLRALLRPPLGQRPYPAAEADIPGVPHTQVVEPELAEPKTFLFIFHLPTPRRYHCAVDHRPGPVAPSIFERDADEPI